MRRSRKKGKTSAKPTGLVGHWRFDGTGGVAVDASGAGNHGAIIGATRVAGKNVGGLDFDGDNDYTDHGLSNGCDFRTSAFSVCAWINRQTSNAFRDIMSKRDSSKTVGWAFCLADTERVLFFAGTGNDYLYSEDDVVPTSTWVHATFVRDGTSLKCYINGEYNTGNTTVPADIGDASSETLYIGNTLVYGWYPGILDDVRIYNVALTPAQVKAVYDEGVAGAFNGLVGHWRFDETGTGVAIDYSGCGNHAPLVGATRVAGNQGGAVAFGGDGDYIAGNTAISSPTAFTILFFFKRDGNSGGTSDSNHHLIIDGINGAASWNNRIRITQNGDTINCDINDGSSKNESSVISGACASWTMLGAMWDGSTLFTIVNKVKSDGTAASGTLASGSTNFRIGQLATNYYYTNGKLDDFMYYNTALSQEDINKYYDDRV